MKLATLDLNNSIYLEKEAIKTFKNQASETTTFDSYHNTFFESYWKKYTVLGKAQININIKGKGNLNLIRESKQNKNIIAQVQFDNKDLTLQTLHFDLSNDEYSRVYFSVTGECEIENSSYWSTTQDKVKDIKLAVIMCTFNKQEYIKRNLDTLFKSQDFLQSNIEIFVIDNASNLNLEENEQLHYFQQGNFGGAGGFTRGLVEARQTKKFTHYQFMDDDILLDPDSLQRAVAYMSFTEKEYAFSGAMLCLDNKNHLWESGADFTSSPKNLSPQSHFHDVELNQENLLEMSQPYEFEYGAWWFNMFSEKAVEKVGLPIPFFIRGDDIEYGIRLNKAGIQTINLPGVGVWHETFHSKLSFWLTYYNTRNFLIISLLHDNLLKMYYKIYKVLKAVGSDLLFFQYERNIVILRGLKDVVFNFGKIHKLSTPKSQANLFTDVKSCKDKFIDGYHEPNTKEGGILTILLRFLTLNFHLFPLQTSGQTVIDSENWKKTLLKTKSNLTAGSIYINNKHLGKALVLDKNYKKFFVQLFGFFVYLTTLAVFLPFYKVVYLSLFKKYRTTEFWNKFLKEN